MTHTHCHIHGPQAVLDLFHEGDEVMVSMSDSRPRLARVIRVEVQAVNPGSSTYVCTCGRSSIRYACQWGDRPHQWGEFYGSQVSEVAA